MLSLAIPNQACRRESIVRKPWTAEARNDVLAFLVQSFGLIAAAIFVYSLGPALGMTLIAVSLAAWAFLRSQIASDEGGSGEGGGQSATLPSSSDGADSVRLRSGRCGTPATAAARSVQRQGV
jgi:hypothetical protein